MNSGNPMLGEKRLRAIADARGDAAPMTFNGALNKTALLALILLVGAAWTWADMSAAAAPGFSGKMLVGLFGIGFSLFVIVIATLNLVLDFDLIDRMSASGMPKHMEWYGAFALMVTLVWLYIEILRLLAKTRE